MNIPINQIIQGDSLEVLKTFPSESFDCVITSPPYWNLRDYGVAGQLGLEITFQEYIKISNQRLAQQGLFTSYILTNVIN